MRNDPAASGRGIKKHNKQGVSKNLLDLGIKVVGGLPLKKKSLTLFDSA